MRKKLVSLGLRCVALVALASGLCSATTLGFVCITNDSGNCPTLAKQLQVDATDAGGGIVAFKFSNLGPLASFIGNIYFDEGNFDLFIGIDSIGNGPGVSFVPGGTPKNLPAGETIDFTSDFQAEAVSPKPKNGVNPGQNVTINMDLTKGSSFFDVFTALNLGGKNGLRLGIHVQGFGQDFSESLVNIPPTPIPDPPIYAMIGLGLAALAALRRRRSRNHSSTRSGRS